MIKTYKSTATAIAILAFGAVLAAPLQAGTIKSKFKATNTYAFTSPTSTSSGSGEVEVSVVIAQKGKSVRRLVITETSGSAATGLFTNRSVVSIAGRTFIDRSSNSSTAPWGSSSSTGIDAGRATVRVKQSKTKSGGRVAVTLASFPREFSDSGFSDIGNQTRRINATIGKKSSVAYVSDWKNTQTSSGGTSIYNDVTRGKGKARGKIN